MFLNRRILCQNLGSVYQKSARHIDGRWTNEKSDFSHLSNEERQGLTHYFYEALYKHLKEDYEIVEQEGPGVMRLPAAIIEPDGAKVALNVTTTAIPQIKILSPLGGLATDTAVIVGKAGFEAELIDSVANKRLAAAVGRRVSTKTFRGMFRSWNDVGVAFDTWAEDLRKHLAKHRAEK